MNLRGKSVQRFFKNFTYSFMANCIVMLSTAIITFGFPKKMGIESYAWFQLFLLYVGYAGIFHLGICDGLYIKIAGKKYSELNSESIRLQFWIMNLVQVVVMFIVACTIQWSNIEGEKRIVLGSSCVYIILTNAGTFLSYVLQATERLREFSIYTVLNKSIYLLCALFILIVWKSDITFEELIIANILGVLVALVYGIFVTKCIVFGRISDIYEYIQETIDNMQCGFKLLVANIAGILMNGITRMGIEKHWDIATFGKVSLALSMSQLLSVFINSVSIVFFPILNRIDDEKKVEVYGEIRNVLVTLVCGVLIFYYPINSILKMWLPSYSESLEYMAILLPICIFSSKNSLLITNYMKALRMEKEILFTSILSVVLSFGVTCLCVFVLDNLIFAIIGLLFLTVFKSILSELLLSKRIGIIIWKNIIWECVLATGFVYSNWCIKGIKGMLAYLLIYIVYVALKICRR